MYPWIMADCSTRHWSEQLMNKPTIILVHGYNGIPNIFAYFEDVFKRSGYKIVLPVFPTRTDITVEGYFSVFDRYVEDFGENTIAIAHSVGNIMALKYLCAKNIRIRGYVGLAGFGEPFTVEGRDDLNSTFASLRLNEDELLKLPTLIGEAHAFYSDSDHLVPFELLQKFPALIGADGHLISGVGHMGSKSRIEELPEVVEVVERMR